MTNEERYIEFVDMVCEILGFNKPIDVLKLCQKTSEFVRPYEMKIKELEQENGQLKAQIEKMKCCTNCKHNECRCEDVVCKKENECWHDKAYEEFLELDKVKLECWELTDRRKNESFW